MTPPPGAQHKVWIQWQGTYRANDGGIITVVYSGSPIVTPNTVFVPVEVRTPTATYVGNVTSGGGMTLQGPEWAGASAPRQYCFFNGQAWMLDDDPGYCPFNGITWVYENGNKMGITWTWFSELTPSLTPVVMPTAMPSATPTLAPSPTPAPARGFPFSLQCLQPGGTATVVVQNTADMFLTACENCIAGQKYPFSVNYRFGRAEDTYDLHTQWEIKTLANGKYAFKSVHAGLYLARCDGCYQTATLSNPVFAYVAPEKVDSTPSAQWDVTLERAGNMNTGMIRADDGLYLTYCTGCVPTLGNSPEALAYNGRQADTAFVQEWNADMDYMRVTCLSGWRP